MGEFVALLAIDTLLLTEPAAVGAKFTLNVVFCPAPKLNGVKPLMVKPAPVTLPPVTLTLALPVLVNVIVRLLCCPRSRFQNSSWWDWS